jgi:hypothetical protein
MDKEIQLKKKNGRTELLLLIIIFAAPVLGAWLIFNYTNIGKGDSSSYGSLVEPPVAISEMALYSLTNGAIAGELHGKWSLIFILPAKCVQDCQQKINMLKLLKSSLVQNSDRLQLIVAHTAPADNFDGAGVPTDFNWGNVLVLSFKKFYGLASKGDDSFKSKIGEFLLVDPAGNIMMRYNAGSEGSGILQDIKRLLRYSRAG